MGRYADCVHRSWVTFVSALLLALVLAAPAGAGQAPPPVLRQVAPDLYFDLDGTASNSIIWVTGEGVLLVDTKQHPRQAHGLIARIRGITDKPIRWVFVTQAHGDHYLGNQVFKETGATIVSQNDVARLPHPA